ncbi:MAG: metallophosphoesterase [Eubacteriales bacterium]|nr:metallophosphoesterase [Eubacteriales bacterium]
MKILFLHLSDAHLRENTKFTDININAMVNALVQMGDFDECVIVFSGDIVQSGEKNQYKVASIFLSKIINGIKNRYLPGKIIQTLITPGNHDNLAADPKRGLEEIKGYYASPKEANTKFYEDLKQLNNFYEFANRNRCYNKERVVDVRKLQFKNFIVKANLINSAPFSLLCNGNEDKGLHYLPQNELKKLDFDRQQNYTISIIHHGPEWYSDGSKQQLYNKLYETSDLIFVGHEHFSLSENKIINAKHKVDISSGVALYGTDTEQGFNACILDTKGCALYGKKFIYNGKIYKPTPNLKNEKIIFKGKNNFTPAEEFKRFLETDIDEREGESYLDYFVFPSMEAKNINDELKNYSVSSEEKFMELLQLKNKILIEGGNRAGKTILAKYLCRILLDDYVPIYMNVEKFSLKDNRKVIKYALTDEYGDNADIDEFFQLDVNKRVIIVDDYDAIKKERWQSFWNEYKDQIGHFILFSGIDWNLNIKEKTMEELSNSKMFYLKICPFYYSKREQLIRKICVLSPEETKIEEKARKINDDITDQIRYFQLNPDFIHQFVDYYLSFSKIRTQKETNVFSKVFEANITFRLAKNIGEENVSEIMIALDFVADYIHFNKKYPLSTQDFVSVVNMYNEKYDNKLNPIFVYEVAKKSNIIREVYGKEGIEFCDENLLAYFTAAHLNRTFNEGTGEEKLKYILENICFQPNGDIILFLSYITSNVQILIPIMTSLINHMEEWKELNLDEDNIGYLSKIQAVDKPQIPTDKEKKKIREEKNNMEKEIVENHKRVSESLYSYDEKKANSFENKITKSINYLELVAKILPNFRFILTGMQRKKIVEILYTYPNKLLYFMLKDINERYDEIIDEILKSTPTTRKGKLITKDMVAEELQNQSIAYILSIYDFIASTSTSNSKTIMDLNRLDYFNYEKNINYRMQNVMMEENVGNFRAMANKAEKIYKDAKLNISKQMVTLIIRKYFLCHDIAITGEAQHVLDVFFQKNEELKKAIRMLQAKNRIVKK